MSSKQEPERRPHEGNPKEKDSAKSPSSPAAKSGGEKPDVTVRETTVKEQPVYKSFPGGSQGNAPLRVAMSRQAFADITFHAREYLDAEVCGVLAGEICEDDHGMFVQVNVAIQGTTARQGSTHVTFTHETWDHIHGRLDREFPRERIVGWYHSHPGFGVEFSEMDLFIQRNFFPAEYQVALVTDPLGGDTAICIQEGKEIRYLDRFWVEGREVRCVVPRGRAGESHTEAGLGAVAAEGSLGEMAEAIRQTETRLQQVLQSVEEQRNSLYRFVLILGLLLGTVIIAAFGYNLYLVTRERVEPPKTLQVVPVPVKIGDQTVLLEVGIASWKIPESLDLEATLKKEIRKSIEEEMQKSKEEELQKGNGEAGTGAAAPAAGDKDTGS